LSAENMAMSNAQRGFLQSLMKRKYINVDEAIELYNTLQENAGVTGPLVASVGDIDRKIGEINRCVDDP